MTSSSDNVLAVGQYRAITGTCPDHCLTCSSTSCLSCSQTLMTLSQGKCVCSLMTTDEGLCLSACRLGEYSQNGHCTLCASLIPNCFVCTALNTCSKCQYPFFLASGNCVIACAAGAAEDLATMACVDSSQISLKQPRSCLGAYYFKGTCVTSCPQYYGALSVPTVEGVSFCVRCPANCLQCPSNNPNECVSCLNERNSPTGFTSNGPYFKKVNGKCLLWCLDASGAVASQPRPFEANELSSELVEIPQDCPLEASCTSNCLQCVRSKQAVICLRC